MPTVTRWATQSLRKHRSHLDDGREAIIDATVDDNYDPGHWDDVFTGINLGVWGTDRASDNYSFGEAGLSSKYIKLTQYLASNRKGLMLGSNGDGDTYWFSVLQGWDGIKSVSFEFTDPTKPEGMASALLTVTSTNGQVYTKTLSYFKDYDFAGDPRTVDGCVIFLKGSAADYRVQPDLQRRGRGRDDADGGRAAGAGGGR